MTLLAIPNLSEGKRTDVISSFIGALESSGARVLDLHSDAVHNRSVVTLTGDATLLPGALAHLAVAAAAVDLTRHVGVHPRLGTLDVCPIVPYGEPMEAAVAVARETGKAIHFATGTPIYFYGHAATRPETMELPTLRKGGLQGLIRRAGSNLPPDLGRGLIDPSGGVVCVGARDVLIAFNVWLRCPATVARRIARAVRGSEGGLPAVRSLGLRIDDAPTSQVSMNLLDPQTTGIDRAFNAVAELARSEGVEVSGSEIVGLVPEPFMPDPNGRAARTLIAPSRSLETALNG